jgi:carboxylesterase type B
MISRRNRVLLQIFLMAGLLATAYGQTQDRHESLRGGFLKPPDSAKPLAYWWWLNGHTDKATITSDLEAMRRQGYGGAILMDANGSDQGGNIGVVAGPEFASPAWRDLFLHTLQEAQRLGLQISLTIQSGWNVGGPTVSGAQSAKLLTWSRKIVHGPGPVSVQLDQPPMKNGFYRDIALLAYPLRHGAALAGNAGARQPIRDLRHKAAFLETGMSVPDSKPLLGDFPTVPGEQDFDLSEEVNLTAQMSPDGRVAFAVPAGDWELLRIGYTSSDARVSTSSGAWQGLVIDYMDRDALTSYWETNVQPLLTAAKPWLGKSLKYVYTDSWEVGGLNWTGRFRETFLARRGYDPVAWLPVVAGRIVTSRDSSNRFLNDFRRTIGDLILSDHYEIFGELAAKNGLGFHPESGGPHGAPIDALQLLGADTFPQTEFWAPSQHRATDLDRFFVKEASSAAHIYGKTLVAGEGLTSLGPQWEESPARDLKPTFDQAVCEGLNLLVWHTFTSSPSSTSFPGEEYFAGTHFNPKVTWFRDGKAFIDYIGRVQFMMQQGLPVSDVLYYYGDQVPNFVEYKGADPAHVLPGYDYDVVDEDVLTKGLTVANHRIRLANGTEYRELVLPPLINISLPALEAIEKLVDGGATVVGNKPTRLTGLPTAQASDSDVMKIADRLWAGCSGNEKSLSGLGAGKIVCGTSARQALEANGVQPDLTSVGPAPDRDFDFAHRRGQGAEIYFIRNQLPEPIATTLSFRVRGLAPEIFDPETGVVTHSGVYAETADRRTDLPMWFAPYGTAIIVFRKPAGPHLVRIERDGQELFPKFGAGVAPFDVTLENGTLAMRTEAAGNYSATDQSGRAYTATVAAPISQSVGASWTLQFAPGWGAPLEVHPDKLQSWTKFAGDGVRHFSGTATYTTEFQLPQLPAHARVVLDLGVVHETARVSVNSKEIGVAWKFPYALDITSAAVAGKNTLRLEVTNLWPNRIIGDQSLPENKRFTHTNITKYTADSPLLPSGLLGPVRLTITSEVPMRAVGSTGHGEALSLPEPRVTIDSGMLSGTRFSADRAEAAFLGVPYAAAPTGNLRWRPPQPVPAWTGVREAKAFGPACPQLPSGWLPEMLGRKQMVTDEACLYLNVWTTNLPAIAGSSPHGSSLHKAPVMVWIHGGGNVEGSQEWPPLGPTLARHGVVVVSINYRLGVFGFFSLPRLTAESTQHASGNYGLLDQIEALKWVRRNIDEFGGDPTNVTVFGASSGSLDICDLMASPLASGLFEKAILQSGFCVDNTSPTLSEVEAEGQNLARQLGVSGDDAQAIDKLLAIPAERLLQQAATDHEIDFNPNVDKWVLPDQPWRIFSEGKQARIPVIVGSNADEVSIFASPLVGGESHRPKTIAEYRQWLQQTFHDLAPGVLAAYPAKTDSDVPRAFLGMDSDYEFGFGAWLLARETQAIGQTAFLYRFTYVGSGEFASLGAFHSEESILLSKKYWTSWVSSPDDEPMSQRMIGYWTQFAKTSRPEGPELPPWAAYEPSTDQYQELGRHIGQIASGSSRFSAFMQSFIAEQSK